MGSVTREFLVPSPARDPSAPCTVADPPLLMAPTSTIVARGVMPWGLSVSLAACKGSVNGLLFHAGCHLLGISRHKSSSKICNSSYLLARTPDDAFNLARVAGASCLSGQHRLLPVTYGHTACLQVCCSNGCVSSNLSIVLRLGGFNFALTGRAPSSLIRTHRLLGGSCHTGVLSS